MRSAYDGGFCQQAAGQPWRAAREHPLRQFLVAAGFRGSLPQAEPHRYYSVEADLPGRPLFVIYNVHLICEPD